MLYAQLARERGQVRLALSLRTHVSPRETLAGLAFVSVAVVTLALPSAPSGFASAAPAPAMVTLPPGGVSHVFRPAHPVLTETRPEPPAVRLHRVETGETLFTIADGYGVTPQTVAYNNGLSDSGALRAGMELRIPTIDAALYEVRRDDTVEAVAARFGADPAGLAEANRLLNEPQNFSPGATVLVPVADGRFPGFRLRVSDPPRAPTFPRTLTRGGLLLPVPGIVTQGFSSWHTAVDVAAPYGTRVVAAAAGTIAAVGWVPEGGLRVCVRHDWGLQTCYYHLGTTLVQEGDRVARGQPIGSIGLTGLTTGPHVHWEASVEGAFVDPLSY